MNILRINMSELKFSFEPLPADFQYIGGRGLIAKIMHVEVDPKADPLGAENKLIIATGPLAGTLAPQFGRISIGGISPLTLGIKESNAGGTAAQCLDKLGIRTIIIEGQPKSDTCFLIRVSKEGVEITPDISYKGLKIYPTAQRLIKSFGKNPSIICIGPCGENLYKSASISLTDIDGDPSRVAGQGGMGAVMGSKGIKAIIIESEGLKTVPIADRELFNQSVKDWIEFINHDVTCRLFSTFGTSLTVANDSYQGMMASNLYRSGQHEDFRNVSGEVIRKNIWQRGGRMHACMPGCVVKCSQIYHGKNGDYITSSYEYESVSMLGTNLGICDPDSIGELKHICDDLGLGFIEIGGALAVAADAGKMKFGDKNSALELLNQIEEGTEFGVILANGVVSTAKALNVKRIPAFKGQAMPAHDPRGKKAMGVTYSTNPMGADHTAGLTYKTPLAKKGQIANSISAQLKAATCDTFGYCLNAVPGGQASIYDFFANLLNARFGADLTRDQVLEIGKQTLRDELNFNKTAKFSQWEDFPEFITTEQFPPTKSVFDVDKSEIDGIWDFMNSYRVPKKVWEVRFPELPDINFGIGTFNNLGRKAATIGIKNPLIVCDPGIFNTGIPNKAAEILGRSNISSSIFNEVEADPPVESINQGAEFYTSHHCDGIIAIGGGSSMDSAKAISVKVSQPGPLTEYENMVGGKAKIVPPLPPIICIPTSAGTGSETNQYAVITDKERKLKFTLMSDHMIPKLSIIDPELTKTMPPAITASTGIDALAHCVEGYVGLASKYHPYYEALALYGVKLIGRSLVNAYKNGLDLSARRDMSMAAAFGGICFTKGLGLGHAIGHAIGAYHHIPHGSACAIGLLIFVKANEEICKEEFQDLAWALSRTDDLLTALKGLYAVLEIPNSFSEMGIKRNDLDEIAYETYINAVNLAANPKSLSEKQIYELIQSSY